MLAAGWPPDQIESQVPVAGGRSVKGGLVVDFVLYTPLPIPIVVNGEYWHRNDDTELLELIKVQDAYGQEPKVIWGDDAETDEEARATVLRLIGRR